MRVLTGILQESKEYYIAIQKELNKRIGSLPKGSVKKRNIYGRTYYYLQLRNGEKVVHKYLGKEKPVLIEKDLKKRKLMLQQLKEAKQALEIIRRSEGKRNARAR
ncbi:hypothetical protein COY52_12775 [Candidatus Desantisbacteria bacterium CG_4_10_14_0_8_um_filter_48_22]|uniref:DUF6788 domain-containing protein n=1 Tax=Candidatus Desantisbacteria bacterium CG_4_10_14_0_8_um_filter_48_22 TaxID=1974543 RepID=A0A2M7S477_9BACT|nr:MAG: hypothetical protein COY52_12775 [Candidatus Desantisbacteria bacterium CG_4_10_14_0_8_um_filter_48_22]